ncbi:MAG: tetraacyldisaccharide 4'-kinase [Halomonadaceae bacterium]|nr:MAG: tetraacyldisaccharide 4'-kinase [Halomonadaceae bacterium]
MKSRIERYWYASNRPLRWLWPLAQLFTGLARLRRYLHTRSAYQSSLPVLVVGNVTVGGTGKSPFTAWLAAFVQTQGWQPVILSRGYGGSTRQYPQLVGADSDAAECGDEPVMLAQQTGCPVVIDPQRRRAAAWVEQQGLGNLLICDDGLQHYHLARDLEFVLFDGARGAGNGAPLPVGPLREALQRLRNADYCLSTGEPVHESWRAIEAQAHHVHQVTQQPGRLRHLHSSEVRPLQWLSDQTINGVAGIANPERFFDSLIRLGAKVIPHPFPDHHRFVAEDFNLAHGPVVMTAKDAVKCRDLNLDNVWVLEVTAAPDAALVRLLTRQLANLKAATVTTPGELHG